MALVTVKVEGLDHLQSVFNEYMKYSKRVPMDACNIHMYFILLTAIKETVAATKEEIERDLNAPSSLYPNATVAAILVNYNRGKKGLKGYQGGQMADAVEKFIRRKVNTRNYLRVGWKPALKEFKRVIPSRRGAPKSPNVRSRGKPLGEGKPARLSWTTSASAVNAVHGPNGSNSGEIEALIEVGAVKAVQAEIASMLEYIEKKMEELANRFNAS